MSETFKFELVSPEKLIISEQAEHVVVPGAEGDFGVLAGHAPFISSLKAGVLKILGNGDREQKFYVRGGFAEAGPEGLTVLAQKAIPFSEFTDDIFTAESAEVKADYDDSEDGSDVNLSAKQALDQLELLQTEVV